MPRKTAARAAPRRPFRRFNEAAARCRGKREHIRSEAGPAARASMRPRPDAAENVGADRRGAGLRWRFNEAAARCRGKRRWRTGRTGCSGTTRFNEAAARCRGKHGPPAARGAESRCCFNEAAARCRGKPVQGTGGNCQTRSASMRPRPDAAENAPVERGAGHYGPASMRPRPDAAENTRPRHATRWSCVLASMRPRPDAAENAGRLFHRRQLLGASMRPRPDAAENAVRREGKP